MNYGEVLSYITRMDRAKVKPFKTWKGSKVQDWEFEIELLNVGENIEVSKAVADLSFTVMAWAVKVETLARCIIMINSESFITQEQLNAYNKEHNLEEKDRISVFEYRKILINKWDQVTVDALTAEYNKLQEAQQTKLLGGEKGPDPQGEDKTKKVQKKETETESTVEKVVEEVKKVEEGNSVGASVEVSAHLEKQEEDEQK